MLDLLIRLMLSSAAAGTCVCEVGPRKVTSRRRDWEGTLLQVRAAAATTATPQGRLNRGDGITLYLVLRATRMVCASFMPFI